MEPSTLSTSKKNHLKPEYHIINPIFHTRYSSQDSHISVQRIDKNGPYMEIIKMRTRPIDATFLRTCKQIYAEGIRILYQTGTFHFSWHGPEMLHQMSLKGRHTNIYGQKPAKITPSSRKFIRIIDTLMNQKGKCQLRCGWALCDRFLHFLHTIGPVNCSLLTTLSFRAAIVPHVSRDPLKCSTDSNCAEVGCLNSLLMTYGPFIERYCPNIKKLHIRISTTFTNQHEPMHYLEAIIAAYIPSMSSLDKFTMDIYDYNEDQVVPIITHLKESLV